MIDRNNKFHTDVEDAVKRLQWEKYLGFILKIITLGIYSNQKKIYHAEQQYSECNKLLQEFNSNLNDIRNIDSQIKQTNRFEDIRLGEQTFSDEYVLGGDTYPDNWPQIREMILDRDDHCCQEEDGFCNGPLQIHHIVPLSKGGTNELDNLITLCHYHHAKKHPHMEREL